MSESVEHEHRIGRALSLFDNQLEQLENAAAFSKSRYQTDLFSLAAELLESEAGLRGLYERAPRFQKAGVFHAGPWDSMRRLQATLVGGCLLGEGQYPTVEALSELRLLSIASGRAKSEEFEQEDARKFLREAVALNLEFLFPTDTEEARVKAKLVDKARRLFSLIGSELELDDLRYDVVDEIGFRIAQRPINTREVSKLIRLSQSLPAPAAEERDADRERLLEIYRGAVLNPTPLSLKHSSPTDYRAAIQDLTPAQLDAELEGFAHALQQTGIGNPLHAVLLRRLVKTGPEHIPAALGLNARGKAEFDAHQEFACQLLRVALLPATHSSIYGYACLLERGLLSRGEVARGLNRLVDIDLAPSVRRKLQRRHPRSAGVSPNSVLLAGAISVLGQPLGVGQGRSPTCQAARGISLWSEHAPGYLLELLATAARDGLVEFTFESGVIVSNQLLPSQGIMEDDDSLDAVSSTLAPLLNQIYSEMLRRAHGRGEDPHKWVNPALYGRWVPRGFCSALDAISGVVFDFEGMVRRFYATHHPEYNDGYELVYPNPVGIFVTDVHGQLLGPHAVSLRRVASDDTDELRAYFFNPNNEGRQNWGQGIKPSVTGHGEEPGESSLPLTQFVSRLYAFHYNQYEEGDAFAVPEDTVNHISSLARESWGAAVGWSL